MPMVSLDDMKAWLRVEHDEEDELIESLLVQAKAAAEDFCRVSFDENAPEPAKLAVKLMVSHNYEHRDNTDMQAYKSMRTAFESLLYPHRDPTKMF